MRDGAARLGVAPVTLRRWIKRRLIAHVRMGRWILRDEGDLEKFLADRQIEAEGEQP